MDVIHLRFGEHALAAVDRLPAVEGWPSGVGAVDRVTGIGGLPRGRVSLLTGINQGNLILRHGLTPTGMLESLLNRLH